MRMSTDESRDEELALQTIAAAADAGITVFDTARAYGHGATELGHNERLLARGLRRCGADETARIVTKGGMTRTGGAMGPGRSREGDPRRLRGEPRCSRRPADRPLPHPCTRSADAVANLGARAGTTRRRRPRKARRGRERQPPSARRGARARSDRGRAGRAQRLRRPRAPRRSRRALRRGGDRRDRPLSARRAATRRRARSQRALVDIAEARERPRPKSRSRGCSSSLPRWSRSPALGGRRLRAPLLGPRSSPSRTTTESARRRVRTPRRLAPAAPAGGRPTWSRHGRSRSRKEPHRGGVRRPRLSPPQPRRARRIVARARRYARRGAVRGRSSIRPRQHVPDPRHRSYVIETANRHGIEARCIWLERRWRKHRSTWSSGCSSDSASSRLPRSSTSLQGESRACSRRPPRCARTASSSRRRRTRDSRRSRRFRSSGNLRETLSPAASSRPPRWGSPVGSTRSRSSTQPHLI